jgi:hypothetical protein
MFLLLYSAKLAVSPACACVFGYINTLMLRYQNVRNVGLLQIKDSSYACNPSPHERSSTSMCLVSNFLRYSYNISISRLKKKVERAVQKIRDFGAKIKWKTEKK